MAYRYQYVRNAASLLVDANLSIDMLRERRARVARMLAPLNEAAEALHRVAVARLEKLATGFGRHASMNDACGSFNRSVAELLIVRDLDLANLTSPQLAKEKYLALRLQSHHIIEASTFEKFEKKFLALADEVDGLPNAPDRGWWRSSNDMPAIALPQELHGQTAESLTRSMKLFELKPPNTSAPSFSLNQQFNFNYELDQAIQPALSSGSLEKVFEGHIEFYTTRMNERWFERQLGVGGPTLREFLEERRKIARVIDQKIP